MIKKRTPAQDGQDDGPALPAEQDTLQESQRNAPASDGPQPIKTINRRLTLSQASRRGRRTAHPED